MPRDNHSRWQFSSVEELVDFVANLFDIEPLTKRSIRGTGSQVRHRRKIIANERNPSVCQNPILDHITSPQGELVIGAQSFDMRPRRLGGWGPDRVLAAQALMCSEDFSGLDVCESADGSLRTYSDGSVSVSFKSYSESTGPYWEMGTDIKTSGLDFEAAIINSRYLAEVSPEFCAVQKYDQDSTTNDSDLDEYEWGIFAPKPKRVVSLCRVQWNDRRLSGVVSKGSECFLVGGVDPWPEGYPDDWLPISEPEPPGSIVVNPRSIAFTSKPSHPSVTKLITLTSSHSNPVMVTINEAMVTTSPTSPTRPPLGHGRPFGGEAVGTFSNVSGQLTIPPNSSIRVGVTFSGERGLGSVHGSLRVQWDTGRTDIDLKGTLVQEFANQ